MDNEAVARDAVRRYVWSGFYGSDEIVEIIDESIFRPGEIDKDWLRAEIERAFSKKLEEQKNWPTHTDCDRLDRVFDALNNQGILALQNAGYTQSDGMSDVSQFYFEAGGEQSGIEGYCFYHGQDLEGVMESGELWLTFGDIAGKDEAGVGIGQRIRRVFEAAGFVVEWDGSIKTRLLVKGIRWQRRRGMELTLESGRVIRNVKEDDLLASIEGEEFAILSASPDTYIQCAEEKEPPYGYVLEYQNDSLANHFQAVDGPITLERVLSTFRKYLRGDSSWQSDFRWEKMEL
jgi:hypothetical protein